MCVCFVSKWCVRRVRKVAETAAFIIVYCTRNVEHDRDGDFVFCVQRLERSLDGVEVVCGR